MWALHNVYVTATQLELLQTGVVLLGEEGVGVAVVVMTATRGHEHRGDCSYSTMWQLQGSKCSP